MKKALAIFGGSFNPPLNSHFSLAEQIINEFPNIEKVIFLPVSTKYNKRGLEANEHRYNMLKLVCDKYSFFEVSDLELTQKEQLNTVKSLDLFKEIYKDYEIYFITGTDNLRDIPYTWGDYRRLLMENKILILNRGNDEMQKIIDSDANLKEFENSFIGFNQQVVTNLSSTIVRECLKNNKKIDFLIPEEVLNYIKENNLYIEE